MKIPAHHALEITVGTGKFNQSKVSRGTACRALSRRPDAHTIDSDLVANRFARQPIPRKFQTPVILPAPVSTLVILPALRNEGSAAKDLSVKRYAFVSPRNGLPSASFTSTKDRSRQ
jgi:hypothetical protein